MDIRDAVTDDFPDLLAVYNDVIATSTAIYTEQPATLDDRLSWWRARVAQGYPVLVATSQRRVVGFASFGDFRAWPGYRFTLNIRCTCGRTSWHWSRLRPCAGTLSSGVRSRKHVILAGVDATISRLCAFMNGWGSSVLAI